MKTEEIIDCDEFIKACNIHMLALNKNLRLSIVEKLSSEGVKHYRKMGPVANGLKAFQTISNDPIELAHELAKSWSPALLRDAESFLKPDVDSVEISVTEFTYDITTIKDTAERAMRIYGEFEVLVKSKSSV